MSDAIRTTGLTKMFGAQAAVDGLDLLVPAGSVYGFLGPNGSGKTTTIRMLLGLVAATSGEIEVLGRPMPHDGADVLPRVGALVEGPAFHPYLSGEANLRRLDAADALADPGTTTARVGAALERVGLTAARGKKFRAYSLGMKQRLAIAGALLAARELLVLDEPTNGLDPQGTREVRHLIADLAAEGTTVLVSSHLLSEIEMACTHIGIMRAGRLVRQGSAAEIGADSEPVVVLTTPDPGPATQVLTRSGLSPRAEGERVQAPLGDAVPEQLVADLVRGGVRVRGFEVQHASLEDTFVKLTGEGFDVR